MSSAAKDAIVRELPYLRRYARALTGSQERGDRYVRIGLETLLAQPKYWDGAGHARSEIYRLFHEIWRVAGERMARGPVDATTQSSVQLERAINVLTMSERQILILVSLENFSIDEAADILAMEKVKAAALFEQAKSNLTHLAKVDVLIIEDEALIALAVGDIVKEMGHTVVGVAARADAAVKLAKRTRPGLVLADIQLEDGSSGITALQEILRTFEVPVIFVTAHPELLLTGETAEPTFLLTKPFEPLALKTAISQALAPRNAA
jgi:CheY-like chemotaxis protein/DNA-directed RNA polymerase specialized sigma24 family protein